MSIKAVVISLLVFFSLSPLSAHMWVGNLEFLYLLPTLEDTYFVLVKDNTNLDLQGSAVNNAFGFCPGIRLGCKYVLCEGEKAFLVQYTRLSATTEQVESSQDTTLISLIGNSTTTSFPFAGSAISTLRLFYERVDQLYEQFILHWRRWDLHFQLGIENAYIRLYEKDIFLFDSGGGIYSSHIWDQKSKTGGIGPTIGFHTNYNLCSLKNGGLGSLDFVAQLSGSLLVAHTIQDTELISTSANIFIPAYDAWRCISAWHAHVGCHYSTTCRLGNLGIGIGYEFHTYIHALNRLNGVLDIPLLGTCFRNFDLHGLYVRASFLF